MIATPAQSEVRFSRTCRRSAATLALALLLGMPVWAQKVRTEYDRSVDFSRFKSYTWGKNFLITRQLPQDQARIDKAIVAAIDRHLQAKGFQRNDEEADLIIVYKGGGLTDVKMGSTMDISGAWGPTWRYSSDTLGGSPVDVWAGIVGRLQIVVADRRSNTAIWSAVATKEFRDPKKLMKNLEKEVNKLTGKTLKGFPPRRKE